MILKEKQKIPYYYKSLSSRHPIRKKEPIMDSQSRFTSSALQSSDFQDMPKVVSMAFARLIFAFMAQAIAAFLFFRNTPDPLRSAAL